MEFNVGKVGINLGEVVWDIFRG